VHLEPLEFQSRGVRRILMLSISLIYFLFSATIDRVFGWRPLQKPIVVTYHSIHADEVSLFERQMDELSRQAEVVFPDASNTPRNAVAITFDDAFQNVFERALPVLKRHGMPSTIFVPTGYLGASPGWIKPHHNPQRASGCVATLEELKSLDPSLVRLGSHTVTHPRLAALNDDSLRDELRESRRTLENITGCPIDLLSLPYGSWNPKVIQAARAEGYDYVFANVPIVREGSRPTRVVGRIDVSPRDWPWEFRLKIRGGYEWMALAVPAKRELLRVFGRVEEA
jgi:peptidoglycan/xylan/chitin deacetylase (PgdA/CDA1 family)